MIILVYMTFFLASKKEKEREGNPSPSEVEK
jgi:hypothetical protein